MKPTLQVVLMLNFAMPVFSATPRIDFDGVGKKSLNIVQELKSDPFGVNLGVLPTNARPDSLSMEVAYKSASGEWVVQQPEQIEDRIQYYTFPPDTEVRTTYGCRGSNPDPNLNYWRVSAQHTNFPSNAGHINHPPAPNLQTPAGTDLPNPITSRVLPVNTDFVYYWKIPSNLTEPNFLPAYATKISKDATFEYACSGVLTAVIEMKVPDLVELTAGPGYELVGANPSLHPRNHFGTAEMNTAVKSLATDFSGACPTVTTKLSYNDMSLMWGGLYDLNGDWNTPHKEHRFGVNIDVGKRQVKKANRKKLIEQMCVNFTVRSEGDESIEPKGHYHLMFRGAAETSANDTSEFDMDPKAVACCTASGEIPEKCISLYDGGNLVVEPDTPSDCQ